MELRDYYEEFRTRGVEVVALAVNTREAVEGAQAAVRAPYPMLADPDHRVAEAYGVYNLLGDGLAGPAVFVIAEDGRILWSYVGQHIGDRPAAADILTHLP
ncbi:MAG TPA: redoxin domain-containing protein [Anaerolineales bacterium]|nr:redoxin domain-containing protein [Anaerolineae bacterium]HIQ01015.1 redoxin domain-containing protein [Anaerolineales bacterium]